MSACCSGAGPSFRSRRRRACSSSGQPDGIGIQQERVQHHVVLEAARLDAHAGRASAAPISRRRRSSDRAGVFEPRLQRLGRFSAVDGARLARLPARGRSCPARIRPPPISKSRRRPAHPPESPSSHASSSSGVSSDAIVARRACPRSGPSSFSRLMELQLLVDAPSARRGRRPAPSPPRSRTRSARRCRWSPAACSCGCCSTLFCRLSRYILRSTSAARSSAASTEPNCSIRSLRALVADARRAGNVVDGVALEREQVGHLRGLHAHEFLHLGRRRTRRRPSRG